MKQSLLYVLAIGSLVILVLALAGVLFQAQAQSEERELPADPVVVTAPGPLFNYQGELRNAAGNPITNPSLPMTFRLFTTPTGGSACWSETRTVDVQKGQFGVMLGQVTTIPSSCVSGNAYLELVVSGETLSPRELLGSVASAVTANTLVAGAQTQGSLSVQGDLHVSGNSSGVSSLFMGAWDKGDRALMADRNTRILHLLPYSGQSYPFDHVCIGCGGPAKLTVSGPVEFWNNLTMLGVITSPPNTDLRIDAGAGTGNLLTLQDDVRVTRYLTINPEGAITSPPNTDLRIDAGAGSGNLLVLQDDVRITGSTEIHGNLNLAGSCTLTGLEQGESENIASCKSGNLISGAYIEANLMSNEDRAAVNVDRFEEGDLLCWSSKTEQLEKCSIPNDPLVMGVADANGKPIVLGAEDIKVIGQVEVGDYLVASPVPGYAMASENPSFGIVIGQALEANDSDAGVIKAMIRKM